MLQFSPWKRCFVILVCLLGVIYAAPNIFKQELDLERPIVYRGYTSDWGAGHAFVIDGYDDNYFHLNWGWSGSYNGNYLISDLSPGGYTFNNGPKRTT